MLQSHFNLSMVVIIRKVIWRVGNAVQHKKPPSPVAARGQPLSDS